MRSWAHFDVLSHLVRRVQVVAEILGVNLEHRGIDEKCLPENFDTDVRDHAGSRKDGREVVIVGT